MTLRPTDSVLLIGLLCGIVFPTTISAQQSPREPRYKLIDLGTFGGPHSAVGGSQTIVLNNRRVLVGGADTSIEDPFSPLCFDFEYCFVEHAFRWHDGFLRDLGLLPSGSSSVAYAINQSGLVVGWSQNGLIDPITGVPEYVPAVWSRGRINDLGTFGGAFGVCTAVNDHGFVVGTAENSTADPFRLADFLSDPNISTAPNSTQLRAFGWRGRKIFDLGDLGGPGAIPLFVNNRGQVAGTSFTSSTPGPLGFPPLEPFLWHDGVMTSLGTLGGTFGIAAKVTNQGQVVGDSDLEGDSSQHGFSWKNGVLTDIGTLGGNFSTAKWVNESGEVVGYATNEAGLIRAFRWKHGYMRDLGAVDSDPCSTAWSVNEAGQIVGNSAPECDFSLERAFLWEKGQIFNLNTFVPAGWDLYLFEADFINDRGDITGPAVLPNGDKHQYLLLRCGANDFEGCTEPNKHGATSVRNNDFKRPTNHQGNNRLLDSGYVSRIRDRLQRIRSQSSE
jgi:probable HAF family extracellular repeat protein